MNYLAHTYLSFTDEQIVGQFLEDFIKNKDRFTYSKGIQEGIQLHRAIDTFTDAHPAIHEAKKIFSPLVRLYSGAFVDVSMDYFLANDSEIKTPDEWKLHSQKVYNALLQHQDVIPESLVRMTKRMKEDDWLYNYRFDWGIEFSMKNVLNKALYLEKDLPVFDIFLENKERLKDYYSFFFKDLEKCISNYDLKL